MPVANLREGLVLDIERAWRWLEHWGHAPCRLDLDALDAATLLDVREDVYERVRTLAGAWEVWW